jgi:hypothetical protein
MTTTTPRITDVTIEGRGPSYWDEARDCWTTTEDVVFRFRLDGRLVQFTVPAGFPYDGPSIPRWCQAFLPARGDYDRPAIGHDFAYKARPRLGEERIDRAAADRLFFEACKRCGVGRLVRTLMLAAVGVFGGAVWRRRAPGSKSPGVGAAPGCRRQR